jgi:hypothetical protein
VEDGNGAVVKGFTEGSNGERLGVKIGETLVACRCASKEQERALLGFILPAFTNTDAAS